MLIRDADLSDLQDIFEWRNDAFSRSMSVSSNTFTLNEHTDWYQRTLKNPLKKIYIGTDGDFKVGVVRFELNIDSYTSEVSINLNPKFRGKGYGFTLLSQSIVLYRQYNKNTLRAIVKRENIASLIIFEKSDFHKEFEDDGFYRLTRN
jgi:L-amino acid N-acyltransferase YncA